MLMYKRRMTTKRKYENIIAVNGCSTCILMICVQKKWNLTDSTDEAVLFFLIIMIVCTMSKPDYKYQTHTSTMMTNTLGLYPLYPYIDTCTLQTITFVLLHDQCHVYTFRLVARDQLCRVHTIHTQILLIFAT